MKHRPHRKIEKIHLSGILKSTLAVFVMLLLLNCGCLIAAADTIDVDAVTRNSFPQKSTIYIGNPKTFTVTISGIKAKNVRWKSSNPKVAKALSGKGVSCKIKGVKTGTAVISCYVKGHPETTLRCRITVKKYRYKIKKLTFKNKRVDLYEGDTASNKLTIKPTKAKISQVKYTSSNTSVVKVSSKGVLTARTAGKAVITAKAVDGSGKKKKYTVYVHRLSFSKSDVHIYIGDQLTNQPAGLIKGRSSADIKWSSSNPGVVSVDAAGKIRGKSKGTATITAWINNAKQPKASYKVTVSYPIKKNSTRFIAHRGLSSEAPENTVRAFELAGEAGFWGAETDIRKTSDGYFIAMHDSTLKRMCGVNKRPEEMTLEEIRNLQIVGGNGISKYAGDSRAETVATLEEYLQVCVRYQMVPVIEIKMEYNRDNTDDPYMQEMEIADMKKLYQITDSIVGSLPYMFIDFDYETLLKMKDVLKLENKNNVTLQYISYTFDQQMETVCAENGLEYDMNYKGISNADIKKLRNKGYKVNLWTVDDRELIENYIIQGIDYISTNKRFW